MGASGPRLSSSLCITSPMLALRENEGRIIPLIARPVADIRLVWYSAGAGVHYNMLAFTARL